MTGPYQGRIGAVRMVVMQEQCCRSIRLGAVARQGDLRFSNGPCLPSTTGGGGTATTLLPGRS